MIDAKQGLLLLIAVIHSYLYDSRLEHGWNREQEKVRRLPQKH